MSPQSPFQVAQAMGVLVVTLPHSCGKLAQSFALFFKACGQLPAPAGGPPWPQQVCSHRSCPLMVFFVGSHLGSGVQGL